MEFSCIKSGINIAFNINYFLFVFYCKVYIGFRVIILLVDVFFFIKRKLVYIN